MGIINVYRDAHSSSKYMESIIKRLWLLTNAKAYNCMTSSVDMIINSFNFVIDRFYDKRGVKFHYFEIRMDMMSTRDDYFLVEQIVSNLLKDSFQMVTVVDFPSYTVKFLVNAYSYSSERKFSDCDTVYITIANILNQIGHFDFRVSNFSLFQGEPSYENYQNAN